MTRSSLATINWVEMPGGHEGNSSARPRADLTDVLAAASAAGFTSVGLDTFTLGDPRNARGDASATAAELAGHRHSCSEVGVLLFGIGTARADAVTLAELAGEVGAAICMAAFAAPVEPESVRELRDCAEILSRHGIRLALEFVSYGPLTSLSAASRPCDEIGWDRCGLLLDSWHFFRSGAPWQLLTELSARHSAGADQRRAGTDQ